MPSKYKYTKKILNEYKLKNLVKNIKTQDIIVFIDIPKKRKNIKLLNKYKNKILGSCTFDIFDKIVQIKHLNYLNKYENLNKILKVIINEYNLIWIHIPLKNITDQLLQICINNFFTDFYISNVSLNNQNIPKSI